MDRQKAVWLESERHYLHSIIHGCRELRHYLLPLYDSCNTAEFFWSIETILNACYIADRVPKLETTTDRAPTQKTHTRKDQSCDDIDNEDGDRVDTELLKMPLMKLLKMELEALFKLTRTRKKLLHYFSASIPEIESRVFNERKKLETAAKMLEKIKHKLPKYQTLLEYQVVLGCCIMEKFSLESVFFTKTYHTLLTLRFNTLQAFVLRLSKTCQTECGSLLKSGKETGCSRDQEIKEIPRFPYFKYFTRAYGNGFIDSRKYWSEVMSLMVATVRKKRRPKESKPDKEDRATEGIGMAKPEVLPCKAEAIRAVKNGPHPEPYYEMKVLKGYTGYSPMDLPLKRGQHGRQDIDGAKSGMDFSLNKSHLFLKKKTEFYPSAYVTPQKTYSM